MRATSRTRVLIADDHVLVAEALQTLLSRDFDVVALVHDGRNLIDVVQATVPDVVLLDISMPVLNGLHAGERVKRDFPQIKIIYVTVSNDPEMMNESLARGGDGYVLKTAAPSELVTAIRCAMGGQRYVSAAFSASKSQPSPETLSSPNGIPTPAELTDRQLDILQLLAEGRSMKEVASVLNLATRTVAFHKYRMMRRLNLHNDSQVVQYAVQHHIIAAR
jgi:DNA-binding NarL/FixJ family response regulator